MKTKYMLASFLLLMTASVTVTYASDCAPSQNEREVMLKLSFKQFDQQQDSGWRPLYAKQCYVQAAALLDAYMKRHPDTVRQQYMLPFHTGQMFALAGQYGKAIDYMRKGYTDRKSSTIDWNAFVDANIAFLEHDHSNLLKKRNRINRQPPLSEGPGVPAWAVGKKMNLDVVDGFLACFDKPYADAYGDKCREQGRELTNDSLQRTR